MSPEVALDEMEKTLNALAYLENGQRVEICTVFRHQVDTFEEAFQNSDPQVKQKVKSLLWFCDKAAQEDSPLGRLNSSALEWPIILLQSIRDRISRPNRH